MHHENLVNFVECYLVQGRLYVIMECLSGGSLTNVVDTVNLDNKQIAFITKEVLTLLPPFGKENDHSSTTPAFSGAKGFFLTEE